MSDLFDLPFEEEPEPPVTRAGSPVEERAATGEGRPAPEARTRAEAETAVDSLGATTGRHVLTVTELTVRVRDLLESNFYEVWVEGELSNCRIWNNGHLYFTLKDSASQVRGFMFRTVLRYLRFRPEDGVRVVARGRISVYEPRGEYQLLCEHLEPHGLGALQLAFDQLKKRLQAEGLFDAGRKRLLPALPRKVGVVTSLEGAAIRDIINVLRRRYGNAHVVIRPARVQGDGAAVEIARGVKAIGRVTGVDVIIVGRGGGSIEDLWAFNEEIVARAIAAAPVPVISAVGHETDFTIADFVADVRAPTPSAAAELVVSRKDEFCGRIDRLHDRLRAAARRHVQGLSRRVHILSGRPALAGFPGRVAMKGRYTAELAHLLAHLTRASIAARERRLQMVGRQLATFDLGRRLAGIRTRLVTSDGRLHGAIMGRRHRAEAQLGDCAARLESLSPLGVLRRGYAVAWNGDRTRVLRAASDVAVGDNVRVTLAKGELDCDVRSTSESSPKLP